MIKRLENRLLLTPNDLTPSARGFRALGVFNPGAVRYRNKVILLIRVAEMPEEKPKGTVPYPQKNYIRYLSNANRKKPVPLSKFFPLFVNGSHIRIYLL